MPRAHPNEAHQEDEKSIKLNIIYMFYTNFFKTNWYKPVSWMSESTRSPPGTSRSTSWWCAAGFYFLSTLRCQICFMPIFSRKNRYKLVSWIFESIRSPSWTLSNILMVYSRILLFHEPLQLYIICFMSSVSIQIDINWFHRCHPHRLRDSTLSWTLTYHNVLCQ